jgi:glycosyltransferase involved in cell wall biosynthesis
MRIALDVRKVHDFGIGTYLRNLIRHLPELDTDNQFVLMGFPRDAELLRSFDSRFELAFVGAPNYSIREHFSVPFRLGRLGIDLFHSPHYVLPYFTPCPSVVTIHDAIHLLFPQYLPSRFASLYAKHMIRRAIEKAELVMTVSDASKRDLERLFEVPEGKIRVIPNGIDPAMTHDLSEQEIDRVRSRFQIVGRNALFVGNIKPHKNVERLINAFAKVREESSFEDLNLIVVGDDISKYPALRRAVSRHDLRSRVRFFGFVPEPTLVALYRIADVFVFPSLYEGFGLPVLEAMANGTPVVTSSVSSLPEVVGDAAVTVDPYNVDEIAKAMRDVLTDEGLRATLVERGRRRAGRFSWKDAVARIHEAYMTVLDAKAKAKTKAAAGASARG